MDGYFNREHCDKPSKKWIHTTFRQTTNPCGIKQQINVSLSNNIEYIVKILMMEEILHQFKGLHLTPRAPSSILFEDTMIKMDLCE